jgi:hypothetical protein
MRAGRDGGLLLGDDGKLIGISLGADFTSEHEWGIKRINESFGIAPTEKTFGLKRRLITKRPSLLTWHEGDFKSWDKKKGTKRFAGFVLPSTAQYVDEETGDRTWYGDSTLWTAWDEKTFAALSIDPKEAGHLEVLYDAFQYLDVAIWLGGGGVFQNAGLAIGIASRLSEDVLKQWYEVDNERYDVKRLMEISGIEKRLKKAGKGYYSLSPRKRDYNGQLEIWLNPSEQQSNNSGWYSVQDLDDWIDGKGKIPKGK